MTTMFTVSGSPVYTYLKKTANRQPPVRERSFPRPSIADEIIAQVAKDHEVAVTALVSSGFRRELAFARFDAMTRLRAVKRSDGSPRFSLPHIGWLLGGRDHATVASGLRRWVEICAERQGEAV